MNHYLTHLFKFPFIMVLLSGCMAPIYFDDPQPDFVKDRTAFSTDYHGYYFNYEDSTFINIKETYILTDPYWFGDERRDTLFSISTSNVLKYHKGKYFLNYKDFDDDWVLHVMDLEEDLLTFYCFDLPEEVDRIKRLGSFEEVKDECGDLVKIIIHPSRRGFKELLKKNLVALSIFEKVD